MRLSSHKSVDLCKDASSVVTSGRMLEIFLSCDWGQSRRLACLIAGVAVLRVVNERAIGKGRAAVQAIENPLSYNVSKLKSLEHF